MPQRSQPWPRLGLGLAASSPTRNPCARGFLLQKPCADTYSPSGAITALGQLWP